MLKRIFPVASLLGLLSVVLAGSAAAGGGGGYGGPGHFKFEDLSVNANFVDQTTGNSSANVYVDRGMQSFKIKHTPGGPVVEAPGTVLNVQLQGDTTFADGCWIIPDSAFSVAGDLSRASLNIHATPDMVCPGFYIGTATGGKPGLQSAVGFGGGGGGGGGGPTVITDITVNLSWAGSGAEWTNTGSNVSRCQSYVNTYHSTYSYQYATASGSVGDLAGASDPLSQISHNVYSTNSNSIPNAACNPYGF